MPTVESAQATIYYEVSGSGPALVFAHGAGGNRISWWRQTPHFSARHRVVRFDHRSFGRSVCAPEHFHPKYFAGDLMAILDAEGIERAALVCQSMGGWTGLRSALDYPERVACLVLCGTPGGLITDRVVAAAAKIGARLRDGIQGQAALAPDFPEREPELALLYDQISALNTGVDPTALARLFDEDARIQPEALADYAVPTLMIAGEHDQLFPPESLHEVCALIPDAQLRDFPGAGHSTYFEDPTTFNRIVDDFIAKHLPAR